MTEDSIYISREYLEHYRASLLREVTKANRSALFRIDPNIKKHLRLIVQGKRFQPIEFLCTFLPLLQDAAKKGEVVRVLDVGGGGGDNYALIRRHLARDIRLHWSLLDPADLYVKTHDIRSRLKKSVLGNDTVLWEPQLITFERSEFDLVLFRGSIQYMKDNEIAQVCKLTKNCLVIDRCLTSEHGLTFTHQAFLAGQRFNTSYKSRSIKDLSLLFERGKLKLVYESQRFPVALDSTIGTINGYINTLVFQKKELLRRC